MTAHAYLFSFLFICAAVYCIAQALDNRDATRRIDALQHDLALHKSMARLANERAALAERLRADDRALHVATLSGDMGAKMDVAVGWVTVEMYTN